MTRDEYNQGLKTGQVVILFVHPLRPEEARGLLYSSFPRGIGGGRYLEVRVDGERVELTIYISRELPLVNEEEREKRVEKTMSLVRRQLGESHYLTN